MGRERKKKPKAVPVADRIVVMTNDQFLTEAEENLPLLLGKSLKSCF